MRAGGKSVGFGMNTAGLLRLSVLVLSIVMLASAVYIGMSANSGQEKVSIHSYFNEQVLKDGRYMGAFNPNKKIWVTISLKWRNEPELDMFLKEVNDRRSPLYHHYMSYSEFRRNFAPPDDVYDAILNWIKDNGVHVQNTYPLHNSITLYDTAANISKLLGVKFGYYMSDNNTHYRREYFAAMSAPEIPAAFAPYIKGIDGLNNATNYHLNYYTSNGTDYLTGADYARMYQVYELYNDSATGAASAKHIFATGLRVATVLWEGVDVNTGEQEAPFDPNAVTYYYQHVIPTWIQNLGVMSTVNSHGTNGTVSPGSNTDLDVSIENELDLEMVGTVAPGVDSYCVYGPGKNYGTSTSPQVGPAESNFPDNEYNYIVNTLAEDTDKTLVAVSNSWGSSSDPKGDSTVDSDVEALNAMGITVLASSGDDGDTDYASYPANDAYGSYGIISVGGTTPTPSGYNITTRTDEALMGYNTNLTNPRSSEVVWYDSSDTMSNGDHWGTESGVSSSYSEPWFQQDFVSSIIGATGKTGRATVDIAAAGSNGEIYLSNHGWYDGIAGTSMACPVTAGMIAEMAAYVGVQYGISEHGFGYLLPTIYQLGNDFYNNDKYSSSPPFFDVTQTPSGYHNGEGAYDARVGWDLASGWGVINAWEFVHDIGFKMSASSTSATVLQGQTTSYTINVAFPYMWTCDVGHFTVSGLPSGATASTSVSYVHPAGNGTAASVTLYVSTLPSTPTGTYTLTFHAYTYNHTNGHWGNLTQSVQLTLTVKYAPAPDLTITSISTSTSSVNEGQYITIYATVKNVGDADANNVYVGFYYDTKSASTHIGNVSVGSLAAGSSSTVHIEWNTAGHLGTHVIISYADPDNLIPERNETNNSATTTVTVNGYGVALSVDSPAQGVLPGGTASYNVTVTNTGDVHDTYDLSVSPAEAGWTVSLSQTKVSLDGGASTTVMLDVTAPSNASSGEYQLITLTAVSEGNSSKSASITTNTTVRTIFVTSIHVYSHLDAVINYTTSVASETYIEYGIGPRHMDMRTQMESAYGIYHEVAIQNLTPGMKYFFKIYAANETTSAWSDVYNFTLTGTNDFESADNPNGTLYNWERKAWNYSTNNTESSVWQWGAPSNVGPSSAHSGTELMGTVLNGDYGVTNHVDLLMTPWMDFTNASWVTISFYAWYSLEEDSDGMWDGVTLYYENDSSDRWGLLDPNNNASQYDGKCVSDQGLGNKYIFGGNSGGWVYKSFNTTQINDVNVSRNILGHRVRFIFWFESDEYVSDYPGFYFDDISVSAGTPVYHIFGYVNDSSGNPVSGATVWVNDTTLGISYRVTTDSNGRYDVYTHNGMVGDMVNVVAESNGMQGTGNGTIESGYAAMVNVELSAVPELSWYLIVFLALALVVTVRLRNKK